MRRRAAEYRRPVRRRFSYWIWALFGLFSVASLVLLVVNHNQHEDRVEQPVLERNMRLEQVAHESLNFTEEILSPRSFSRQLAEQMRKLIDYGFICSYNYNVHQREHNKKIP